MENTLQWLQTPDKHMVGLMTLVMMIKAGWLERQGRRL